MLSLFCVYAGGILMLWLTALNFANVVDRYVLRHAIVWAEEVLRFSSTWMVMLAAAAVTLEGTQISFESLWESFPGRLRWIVALIHNVGMLLLSVWIVAVGWETTMRILNFDQRAVASGIPIWLIYLSWPVGFALFVLFLIERIARLLARPGDLEKPAPTIVYE